MRPNSSRRGVLALVGSLGVVVVAALLPFASEGAPLRTSRPTVKTLVTIRGPVSRFVEDGEYVAWLGRRGLVIRQLGAPTQSVFSAENVIGLALGGKQALWIELGVGNNCYYDVYTAGIGDSRPAAVTDEFYVDRCDGAGSRPASVAADGELRVFTLLTYSFLDPDAERGLFLWDGWIEQVSGSGYTPFLQVPVDRLAVNDGRVAVLPLRATGRALNEDPNWSPDGRTIAFASAREGPDTEIETVAADGARRVKVTDNFRYESHPSWSPDGSLLAFSTGDSIRIIRPDGTGERTVATCVSPRSCYEPDWAPDGSRIAFVESSYDGGGSGSNIYLVNVDGSGKTQLSQTGRRRIRSGLVTGQLERRVHEVAGGRFRQHLRRRLRRPERAPTRDRQSPTFSRGGRPRLPLAGTTAGTARSTQSARTPPACANSPTTSSTIPRPTGPRMGIKSRTHTQRAASRTSMR